LIPTRVSILEEGDLPNPHPVPQEVSASAIDLVRCFRCEGDECPRYDGSGFRERKHCAGCGVPAGRPSQGGKALSPERGAKSWKELRSLPLYCMDCNPRFFKAGLALFEEMGG
jgi:hypothetical protein